MLDFMDYIQRAFSDASRWNKHNSYSSLTNTSQSLLDFSTPQRLRVHLSSLSTPQFATSYTLGTVGLIDGSISYLFTTLPLTDTPSRSALIPLRSLIPGYQQVSPPSIPECITSPDSNTSSQEDGEDWTRKPTLLHATLHLPPPTTLTALFLRRISPSTQASLALCSTRASSTSAPQASLLAHLSHDTGKYSTEYLFSTDNALFGFRGLWNFGPDPREALARQASGDESATPRPVAQSVSLLSAGGEAYYSPVSSVVGLSTGIRFTTLPAATEIPSPSTPSQPTTTPQTPPPTQHPVSSFPYTLTLTLTPLTGSLSTTYSLLASPNLSLSSRFGFNVYSWESEMVAGCELWRRKRQNTTTDVADNVAWAKRKMEGLPPLSAVPLNTDPTASMGDQQPSWHEPPTTDESVNTDSVVKIRVDQSWNVRVLWEGRVKELLVSAGVGLGPQSFSPYSSGPPSPTQGGGGSGLGFYGWRGVGVSVLYSS
ncbi:Mitochondrial distribution and morphology protein 10 [Arachnomyces sp. PD_36]|nr:Mitochondrial distribution and morphology protein 10 [Arachnomyces sp. PD_36]